MADKYHSDTQEKVETIAYSPGLQDSGDLEAGTNTITATSEASGLGNADYTQALTLPKPDDARLVVARISSRLRVTIDSMTAGDLYCRVYVDVQDAGHRLYDEDWTSTGDKLAAVAQTSGAIFDLLSDGQAHTLYFFFWVDSGDAVVSLVQLWEAVGQKDNSGLSYSLRLDYKGLIQVTGVVERVGSGSWGIRGCIEPDDDDKNIGNVWASSETGSSQIIGYTMPTTLVLVSDYFYLQTKANLSTDIVYVSHLVINLRSTL